MEPSKTITLRFRAVDKRNFDEIREGLKVVETRAATERYRNIRAGDSLVFVCGKRKLKKRIVRVRRFNSIAALFKAIPLKRVFPSLRTIADTRQAYFSYSGYKEKIAKFGIVAFELET
jgi:ASC-1-like (ASCH) protein